MHMFKNITTLAFLGTFAYMGIKGLSIYENDGAYIETKGISVKEIESDEAYLTISVSNETNDLSQIKPKQAVDVDLIKRFILEKFKLEEIEEKGTTFTDQLAQYSEKNSDKVLKFLVSNSIELKTKDVHKARQVEKEITKFVGEGIRVTVSAKYTYKNMDKSIDEMTDQSVRDSRTDAERIAKASGDKIKDMRSCEVESTDVFSAESNLSTEYDWEGRESFKKRVRVKVSARYNI